MKNRVAKSDLHRYQSLPKSFVGPHQADELFITSDRLAGNRKSWAYLFAAASAAAESGIRASHQSASERHSRVNQADDTWRLAQQCFLEAHSKSGWSDSKLLTIPHRIEMHRIFTPVYHNLIDGAIRTETIQKAHERLVRLAKQNYSLYQAMSPDRDASFSYRLGLGNELGAILAVNRLQWPSLIAIPSTARADDGGMYPEHTHDVNLLRLSHGVIDEWIPYEVKSTANTRNERYLSAVITAQNDLRVGNNNDPLEHAIYMSRELKGTLTKSALLELDRASSRVLAKALEYKSRDLGQQVPSQLGSTALSSVRVA